ncbi:MAG: hypothetical protein WKF43_17355 [Acidimicrobiales bacterium]
MCLAEQAPVFLGEDLLAWLVLALGAAMAAGASWPAPSPEGVDDGELARAPVVRSLVMAAVGVLAALWAVASLLTG